MTGEDAIKKIILDENGFWKPLVEALKVGYCWSETVAYRRLVRGTCRNGLEVSRYMLSL